MAGKDWQGGPQANSRDSRGGLRTAKRLKTSTYGNNLSGQQHEATMQLTDVLMADGEDDRNDTFVRLEDNHQADDSRVRAQINRAKQQLIGSPENHPAIHQPALRVNINAALAEGRVKPLFHALFLPKTFLHNRHSFSEVTAGLVDEERTLEFDYDAKNIDIVVEENGKGAGSIIDAGMESPWEFDHEETAFAVELVKTDAEMLGEDVECTKLTSIPTKINPRDRSSELLTRPESRGVVSNIFHRFALEADQGGSVATITGSLGVGKSWTLFYALQQSLLYDGATVLFYFQKRDKAVMYLRRNNKLYAWASTSREDADSVLFGCADVLVLLDPRDAGQGRAGFTLGEMKLLYAASNNENHISSSAAKNNGGMQSFLGPPIDRELHVILARLGPRLEQTVIEERKKHVGNLIRFLLDETDYIDQLKTANEHLITCSLDPEVLLRAVQAKGMSDGQLTIPGTIFQLLPTRPVELGLIGYEGQNIHYRKPAVMAANKDVRNAILKAGRYVTLSYWGIVSGAEYTRMGAEAKKLFIDDLINPDGMVMQRYLRTSNWKESELLVESGMLAKKDATIDDIFAAVLSQPNVVANYAEDNLQIDAAGPGRKLYHVTVTDGPSMSFKAMENLCKKAGFIDEAGNIAPESAGDKLEFYWVAPERLGFSWKEKPSYLSAKDEDDDCKELVNKCLEIHVNQYVLPMTNVPPVSFSQWKTQKH